MEASCSEFLHVGVPAVSFAKIINSYDGARRARSIAARAVIIHHGNHYSTALFLFNFAVGLKEVLTHIMQPFANFVSRCF